MSEQQCSGDEPSLHSCLAHMLMASRQCSLAKRGCNFLEKASVPALRHQLHGPEYGEQGLWTLNMVGETASPERAAEASQVLQKFLWPEF